MLVNLIEPRILQRDPLNTTDKRRLYLSAQVAFFSFLRVLKFMLLEEFQQSPH